MLHFENYSWAKTPEKCIVWIALFCFCYSFYFHFPVANMAFLWQSDHLAFFRIPSFRLQRRGDPITLHNRGFIQESAEGCRVYWYSVCHSQLLGHYRWEITSYADGVGIGQFTAISKSRDKNMAALCVCCGESKSKSFSSIFVNDKELYAE